MYSPAKPAPTTTASIVRSLLVRPPVSPHGPLVPLRPPVQVPANRCRSVGRKRRTVRARWRSRARFVRPGLRDNPPGRARARRGGTDDRHRHADDQPAGPGVLRRSVSRPTAWLRDNDPVHWDPVHRIWGVSRYDDVVAGREAHRAVLVAVGLAARDRPARRHVDDQPRRPRAPEAADARRPAVHPARGQAARGRRPAASSPSSSTTSSPAGTLRGHRRRWPRRCRPSSSATSSATPASCGPRCASGPRSRCTSRARTRPTARRRRRARGWIAAMMDFAAVTMDLIAQRRADPQDDLISLWADHRGRRPHVDRRRDHERVPAAARRRRRDHAHGDRRHHPRARPAARAAPDPARPPRGARRHRGRGVHPLGHADPQHAPHRHRATTSFRGQELHEGDEVLLMYGSANRDERVVRRPRPLRRHPGPQPPRGLRVRHPLLPRRVAGPASRSA